MDNPKEMLIFRLTYSTPFYWLRTPSSDPLRPIKIGIIRASQDTYRNFSQIFAYASLNGLLMFLTDLIERWNWSSKTRLKIAEAT